MSPAWCPQSTFIKPGLNSPASLEMADIASEITIVVAGDGIRPLLRDEAAFGKNLIIYPEGKQGGTAEKPFVPDWTKGFLFLEER